MHHGLGGPWRSHRCANARIDPPRASSGERTHRQSWGFSAGTGNYRDGNRSMGSRPTDTRGWASDLKARTQKVPRVCTSLSPPPSPSLRGHVGRRAATPGRLPGIPRVLGNRVARSEARDGGRSDTAAWGLFLWGRARRFAFAGRSAPVPRFTWLIRPADGLQKTPRARRSCRA